MKKYRGTTTNASARISPTGTQAKTIRACKPPYPFEAVDGGVVLAEANADVADTAVLVALAALVVTSPLEVCQRLGRAGERQ